MIPVTQTEFYDPDAPPDKQRGNCLTAVVASLLELDRTGLVSVDDEYHWTVRPADTDDDA